MGLVELDIRGAREVSGALETVCQDMIKAKAEFMEDVETNLGVDKWNGEAKVQFDRAVQIITTRLGSLTAKVRSADDAFCEMSEIIRRADAHCADGIF